MGRKKKNTLSPEDKRKLRQLPKIVREVNKKYSDIRYNQAKKICNEVIRSFYFEYEPLTHHPRHYDRQYSLYECCHIDVTSDGHFIFELGHEFMRTQHRVNNEYIYEMVFKRGYHGGAPTGLNPDHPNPGVPYWRSPVPHYTDWYKPAARSTPPYTRIISSWNRYINKQGKAKGQEIFLSVVRKYWGGIK